MQYVNKCSIYNSLNVHLPTLLNECCHLVCIYLFICLSVPVVLHEHDANNKITVLIPRECTC